MGSSVRLLLAHVLPVVPVTALFAAVGLNLGALSAVHVVDPLSFIITAISPNDPAIPVELVLLILALVNIGAVESA